MKTLLITATGIILENVENQKAAQMVSSGEAVEVLAKYAVIGHRDPAPKTIENRDPKISSLKK